MPASLPSITQHGADSIGMRPPVATGRGTIPEPGRSEGARGPQLRETSDLSRLHDLAIERLTCTMTAHLSGSDVERARTAATQNGLVHPQKQKRAAMRPGNSALGTSPKALKTGQRDTCTLTFTTANRWRPPKCPRMGEWVNKAWPVHTAEYDSA